MYDSDEHCECKKNLMKLTGQYQKP